MVMTAYVKILPTRKREEPKNLQPVFGNAWNKGVETSIQSVEIERDIHVFGESMDRTEDLGEGCPAFERHGQAIRHCKEGLKYPADPDVLFQHLLCTPELWSEGAVDLRPLVRRQLQERLRHGCSMGWSA